MDVVVLNGGSSAGKSAIARCLQAQLPDAWLVLGIDDLLDAMPPGVADGADPAAITFAADGTVTPGGLLRRVESAWLAGLAAIARAGVGVIVEDVFLDGGRSQGRVRAAFDGLHVLWVGVHCDPEVAERREARRTDRVAGMARKQARLVHDGVHYDVEVDTSEADPASCARVIAEVAEKE